ncbi:helix-turn-helix transcriptional regulator [Roseibium alexandrii]
MRADIIQTRERLGLSQREAAKALGISQGYLSRVEAGVHSPRLHLEAAIRSWIADNSNSPSDRRGIKGGR